MPGNVRVFAQPDGIRALISILSCDVTEEEIETALLLEKVVVGVRKDTISEMLHRIKSTGKLEQNIEIAHAQIAEHHLLFTEREVIVKDTTIAVFKEQMQINYNLLLELKKGGMAQNASQTLFASKNDMFCLEEIPGQGLNIFGKEIQGPKNFGPFFKTDSSVKINKLKTTYEYVALQTGYLTILPNGELSIQDPISISSNKMEMSFVVMPLWHDPSNLISYFISSYGSNSNLHATMVDKEQLVEIIKSDNAVRFLIRKGKPMLSGVDARLMLYVEKHSNPDERKDGSIDFREISFFQQIKEGTLIAEKVLPIEGTQGFDIYGNVIPVRKSKDILFKTGKNVIVREGHGREQYFAGITGLLKLNDMSVEIVDVIIIEGDVGPLTGNLHTDKNVVIKGNVRNDYIIECNGDVCIDGSVENGAILIIKGNLTVKQGILGEKTTATIKGFANIGFIQESNVHVDQDCNVNKYVYNAKLYSGGHLSVNGVGIENANRGCILGGEIVAMGSMTLASVGCQGETTRLYCGINPEVLQTILLIKEKMSVLNKRSTNLRSSLKVDLNSPDIKEKLMNLPNAEKERIKNILLEIKKISQEQTYYSSKLPELEKIVLNPKPESCKITIKKCVVPEVILRISKDTYLENENRYNVVYRYDKQNGIHTAT